MIITSVSLDGPGDSLYSWERDFLGDFLGDLLGVNVCLSAELHVLEGICWLLVCLWRYVLVVSGVITVFVGSNSYGFGVVLKHWPGVDTVELGGKMDNSPSVVSSIFSLSRFVMWYVDSLKLSFSSLTTYNVFKIKISVDFDKNIDHTLR